MLLIDIKILQNHAEKYYGFWTPYVYGLYLFVAGGFFKTIFSVWIPYCSPIVFLSFSYRSPIVLLSFSYSRTENDRRTIGGWTKNNGRCIDYTSVLKRRDSETQKGNQQCGMERKTNKWGSAEQGGSISITMNPKTEIIKKQVTRWNGDFQLSMNWGFTCHL